MLCCSRIYCVGVVKRSRPLDQMPPSVFLWWQQLDAPCLFETRLACQAVEHERHEPGLVRFVHTSIADTLIAVFSCRNSTIHRTNRRRCVRLPVIPSGRVAGDGADFLCECEVVAAKSVELIERLRESQRGAEAGDRRGVRVGYSATNVKSQR